MIPGYAAPEKSGFRQETGKEGRDVLPSLRNIARGIAGKEEFESKQE
jgi:hypothetical protein